MRFPEEGLRSPVALAARACVAWAFGIALLAAAGSARANGAFPDAQTILTPADRPQEIVLATNFGLVLSADGGHSWQWSCERDETAFGTLYQLGPAPRHRLFTVANDKLVFSDDGSCGWRTAGGSLADQLVTDFFPDAGDANRVFAVGYADASYAVFASSDGGATFGSTLYRAAAEDGIGGVEVARSDPKVIYVALTGQTDTRPKLARSADGGGTWKVNDLSGTLGPGIVRIIAVDPQDPNHVLLRLLGQDDQSVALTRDGGATVTKSLSIAGNFTSHVKLPDGGRLLGATLNFNAVPALYRSDDGGATFQELPDPPKIRALSQRDGLVYAATDNFGDGYAVGVSSDAGKTWSKVMSYDQIQAILPCLRGNAVCRATCEALAGRSDNSPGMIWEETVCQADPLPEPPAPASGGGCGCGVAPGRSGVGLGLALIALVGRARRGARARARRRAR